MRSYISTILYLFLAVSPSLAQTHPDTKACSQHALGSFCCFI